MSQIVNLRIQRIIEHPIKVRAPNTTMRVIKIEAITPFHFPNHCSNQLIKESFIPEFLIVYSTGLSGPGGPWPWL
jgi:hypothetical protein